MSIKDYSDFNDGANWQAQCVLAYLKAHLEEEKDIHVVRYNNRREQGYIFFVQEENRQMNVAVYEHRNSDIICIVAFETLAKEPQNSDVWDFMVDACDTTADFDCGQIIDCGKTIIDIFDEFGSCYEGGLE